MALYRWNGVLLRRNGLLATSEACCCDCDCCDCSTYEFQLGGVTGGGDCENANGAYSLNSYVSCGGPWTGRNENFVSASLQVFGATTPPDCGTYRLIIGPLLTGASSATYELSGTAWNCHGCNVMTRTAIGGTCTGWPDTIEVCCADPEE